MINDVFSEAFPVDTRRRFNVYKTSIRRRDVYIVTLHKKMKFSIKDFLSKCDQIRRKLQI